MLATFPITKTSASRMTPELRDNAAFGAVFSDHMLVADYAGGKWSEPRIIPYGAQPLAAAPACAHYGQGIFEGFKAFPRPNGGAVVFRPDANHARMAKTCQRMAMPEVPASIFIDGTLALVQLDRNWIPEKDNSALYVRPVLFATGETLGVQAVGILPLRHRDLPERAVFLGLGGSDRRRHLRARVSRRHRRGQVRRQLRRQHARVDRGAEERASTTCCGSTASSASTSRKRA